MCADGSNDISVPRLPLLAMRLRLFVLHSTEAPIECVLKNFRFVAYSRFVATRSSLVTKSSDEPVKRLNLALVCLRRSKVVITASGGARATKVVPLKQITDKAVQLATKDGFQVSNAHNTSLAIISVAHQLLDLGNSVYSGGALDRGVQGS